MALNPNQFALTTVQGQLDMEGGGANVVSAMISANQVASVIAGQAVKLENSTTRIPAVLALATSADVTWGFVVRNLKDANFPTSARVEVALAGSLMYMTAQTANPTIARGAAVEFDAATNTVLAWAGVNPVIGYAYDAAATAGDLIRVFIDPPKNNGTSRDAKVVNITATLAQINAGLLLIPGAAGKKITVLDYTARVAGNFATGTSVALQSNNGTPVVVSTVAEAGLTTGAILKPTSANTTLGAGFAVPLGTADGLQIVNNGAAQTAGTNINLVISYQQF